MPARLAFHNKPIWTRDHRKKLFIQRKHRILSSDNGLYHTYHIEDEALVWIDFSFLSTKYKNKYFAVAATTLEYAEYESDDEKALDEVDAKRMMTGGAGVPAKFSQDSYREIDKLRDAKIEIPRMVSPTIRIDRTYGPVAIGVLASLNTRHLTKAVLAEFIEMFRDLGEPISHGVVWTGKECEIVPARIKNNA